MVPEISVVIPALNEADRVGAACRAAAQGRRVEVIVVDGGSHDDTVAVALAAGARVVQTTPQRAHQMNVGAGKARGRFLCFVHADTRLPPNFDRVIRAALAHPRAAAGAFRLAIGAGRLPARVVAWGANWRTRLLKLPYGDQALFLPAATFRAVGGFADLPIMEDVVLVKQLARQGRLILAPATVTTSARRWQNLGYARTTLGNVLLMVAFFMGASPKRLARWYQRNRYIGNH
jgi:rSAM/selenodomain-associated transferase 2